MKAQIIPFVHRITEKPKNDLIIYIKTPGTLISLAK